VFIKNHPAMKLGQYLIVADLHIGITKEFYENGIAMPFQGEDLAKKINQLNKTTRTKKTIILGDVKHRVPGTSFHEQSELEHFFNCLRQQTIIIKGNHDVSIDFPVPLKKSMVINNYFLTHGHRRASTKKTIIIGHNHPILRIKDELGNTYTEQVWVRTKNIIIIPAFNPLAGGHDVAENDFMGPIAKSITNPEIYLLDGTCLGTLKSLKKWKVVK
jgi:hypothetical protein